MKSLDHISAAIARAKVYGRSEIGSYHARCMSAADRLAFDLFLVKSRDPLAWQAGSPESRFIERCNRMMDLAEGKGLTTAATR